MSKDRGKKRARGETPPVGPETASAPPPVDREQLIRNAPFHPANDSPRTKKAKDSVNKLKQLNIWVSIQLNHSKLCIPEDPLFDFFVNRMVQDIRDSQTELRGIIPEFKSMTAKSRLKTVIRNVYSNLAAKIASYSDMDEALSLVLVHVAHSLPTPMLSTQDIEANVRFSAQFGRDYYGNAPERFPQFVTEHDQMFNELDPDKGEIYLRGTAIVQSSGTGKSRMVYECRHRTPLLYVCIRPISADGSAMQGYPLPDRGVRAFFEEAQMTHKNLYDLQIACFLGAWFSVLAQRLAERPTQQQKHECLMQLNHLDKNAGENPQRTDFFQTISELAFETLKVADRRSNDQKDYDPLFDCYIRPPLHRLESEMSGIIAHMQSLNPHNIASPTPPVLVAFDECVELNVDGVDKVNNPLNSLRRAWNYISRLQSSARTPTFWLVLISTSSDAACLLQDTRSKTSMSVRLSGPPPTFFGVGLDALLAEQPALSRASEASADSHIIHYGRPLWKTFSPKKLWRMAKFKLTCSEDFSIYKAAHCFSVLASRLALTLSPTESPHSALFARQKQFVDSTVDCHMRIVTRVTSEGVMHVESPSEPVLAIAASNIMLAPYLQSAEKARGYTYADILKKFQQECLLDPAVPLMMSSFGELASRIILMAACDAVQRKRIEQPKPKESSDTQHVGASIYAKPVPLESVLENLADLDEANRTALRQRLEDVYDAGSRTERHAIPFRDQ
ncbi:uncharacterized protein UMAG_04689 [Mycosarcoma maydis]|uniref:Uncharacterized protein n=1 Tax=Mycosarcoma maydis TaxID=5270 RepID=A0A0D1DYM2_MYCMD|nr:uncharacterized protein UMAG_04689 [Ustilago maydis 521]KIS67590.1 hypothetical protein UMAG_04689 [Ustilago maydis 521]|eukprot:XP_011390958.1 hypothetical protein UMAG_04689 [Ustilago maydis 521]